MARSALTRSGCLRLSLSLSLLSVLHVTSFSCRSLFLLLPLTGEHLTLSLIPTDHTASANITTDEQSNIHVTVTTEVSVSQKLTCRKQSHKGCNLLLFLLWIHH